MHETRHFGAALGLDRHHETARTHRDYRVLKIFLICLRAYHPVELLAHPCFRRAHMAAYIRKLRARRVGYLVLRAYGFSDLFLKVFVRGQRIEKAVQPGRFGDYRLAVTRQRTHAPEHTGHAQQLARLQRRAYLRALKLSGQVLQPAERRATVFRHQAVSVVGIPQRLTRVVAVGAGPKRPRRLGASAAGATFCEHFEHGTVLESSERPFLNYSGLQYLQHPFLKTMSMTYKKYVRRVSETRAASRRILVC